METKGDNRSVVGWTPNGSSMIYDIREQYPNRMIARVELRIRTTQVDHTSTMMHACIIMRV